MFTIQTWEAHGGKRLVYQMVIFHSFLMQSFNRTLLYVDYTTYTFCTTVTDTVTGNSWVLVAGGNDGSKRTTKVRYYDATLDNGVWVSLTPLPEAIGKPALTHSILKFSETDIGIYAHESPSYGYDVDQSLFFDRDTNTFVTVTMPYSRNEGRVSSGG